MLLKALEEVAAAPNAMMAAEMAIIRLTHVAELPTPEELVRRLGDAPAPPAPPPADRRWRRRAGGARRRRRAAAQRRGGAAPAAVGAPPAVAEPGPLARYERFEDVVALVRARRDMSLLVEVEARGAAGALRAGPDRVRAGRGGAARPRGAAGAAAAALDRRALGRGGGAAPAAPRRSPRCGRAEKGDLQARALEHPMVQAVLAAFPGAEIREVRPADALAAPAGAAGGRPRTTTTGIRSIRFQRRAECSRVWDSLATWPRS